jgi:DNA-binding XRE family transcriptional regulator
MKQKKVSDEQQRLLDIIGIEISNLRTGTGLSYVKMAKEIGMARNTYYLLEKGKINFQFSTLQLVMEYHEMSFTTFFDNVEEYE